MTNIGMAECSLSKQKIQAALEVLESGNLRQGKHCQAFEEEFAEFTSAEAAVTCANGSASLHLAYQTILNAGDEVLVPSFTFFATGSMVVHAGGVPVFCDVDPETCLIDLEDAAKRITPKTTTIVAVHLYGNPCAIDAVEAFAKEHGLQVVYDSAQAHGARYKGADIGSQGEFVTYSFYPSKNMFVGEGGMICTNSAERAEYLKHLRAHGQTGKYRHTILGFNYRMTDVEAVIGRHQLKRLPEMMTIRNRNAAQLTEGLKDMPGLRLPKTTNQGEHAWHQFVVILEDSFGCDRDTFQKQMLEQGVGTGAPYPRGLHQQPIFEEMYGTCSLPVTEDLSTRVVSVPVHHAVTEEDVATIIKAVGNCYEQSQKKAA